MKKIIACGSFSCILLTTSLFAAPTPAKYEIYPNSAVVTFTAEVNGSNVLEIPGAFDYNSVKIISISGANLLSFKAERITKDDAIQPYYLKTLIKEVEDLEKTLNTKLAKLTSLDLTAAILDSIIAENIKPAEFATFLTTTATLREKNAKELLALNDEIKTLKIKINNKKERIKSNMPHDFQKATLLNIQLSGKGTVTFEASTNSIYWKPKYSMSLNTKTGDINTTLSVSVTQMTGIMWKGDMEFYSDEPSNNLFYQQLPPQLVYLHSNMPAPYPRTMAKSANAFKDMNEEISMDNQMAEAPQITATGLYFKANASIGGDGAEISIPVDKFRIPSEAGYEVTPEYSKYALLSAKVKNLPKPLFTAEADLFIDGKLSASNMIQTTPQGGEIVIPFGISKNITVKKTNQITATQKSIIKGMVKDGYVLEVLNGFGTQINVTVNDRIPYPTDAKISLTNVNISPKATENKDGVHKWLLTIKPKETQKISVSYEIKHPADADITYR